MLPRFANEVLSHGSNAVLPHNLDAFWLKTLQKSADDFLDNNFAADQCLDTVDTGDPLLVACVHQLLGTGLETTTEPSADELAEHITVYALSITMESIRRESDIQMTLPTEKDLLSLERIIRFGRTNPQFGQLLKQACILPQGEPATGTNWLGNIKNKILSRLASD
ncbi:MAG: hypothetical protein CSA26_08920 [Desulfobacterales bacterium]|nr:MAG: hypothetical protein CSA26_08920 [Desulfobacterales bacterium]